MTLLYSLHSLQRLIIHKKRSKKVGKLWRNCGAGDKGKSKKPFFSHLIIPCDPHYFTLASLLFGSVQPPFSSLFVSTQAQKRPLWRIKLYSGGRGSTPPYGLYRDLLLDRVWFLAPLPWTGYIISSESVLDPSQTGYGCKIVWNVSRLLPLTRRGRGRDREETADISD